MCKRDGTNRLDHEPSGKTGPVAAQGTRRNRLWELAQETHCPLIGVCLPMPALRKLFAKLLGGLPPANDYEFHVAAVTQCARRAPVAEALQRELDRRYALSVRCFARAKTTEALAEMWAGALQDGDVAGALWAAFTHARCDEILREQVSRDIHMFQHQAGASARADLRRLQQMEEDNAALASELAALKARSTQAANEHATRLRERDAELMRARGRVVASELSLSAVREELTSVQTSLPSLKDSLNLAQRAETQQLRIRELERERASWREQTQRERVRRETLEMDIVTLQARLDAVSEPNAPPSLEQVQLRDKAVLCVGGRQATVPVYRQLVECTGGRFMHHDGGEEHSAAQLEASLVAADLVICQTGCISHGAYWRVKEHCKRTGKQCLFVEKPSSSSLARCLQRMQKDTDSDALTAPAKSGRAE